MAGEYLKFYGQTRSKILGAFGLLGNLVTPSLSPPWDHWHFATSPKPKVNPPGTVSKSIQGGSNGFQRFKPRGSKCQSQSKGFQRFKQTRGDRSVKSIHRG